MGFERLRALGLDTEEISAIRATFYPQVIEQLDAEFPRQQGVDESTRLARMEDAFMQRSPRVSEFGELLLLAPSCWPSSRLAARVRSSSACLCLLPVDCLLSPVWRGVPGGRCLCGAHIVGVVSHDAVPVRCCVCAFTRQVSTSVRSSRGQSGGSSSSLLPPARQRRRRLPALRPPLTRSLSTTCDRLTRRRLRQPRMSFGVRCVRVRVLCEGSCPQCPCCLLRRAGWVLGFFLGFLMLLWVFQDSVSSRQKVGIFAGVAMNMLFTFARQSAEAF